MALRWIFAVAVAFAAAVFGAPPVAAAGAPGASSGGGAAAVKYRPPVIAPISDSFRPPAHRYGAGNRGLEYRTTPGTPVAAIGPGRVTFSGQVAGRLVVSVEHPDGLRSSLTGLASISVIVGDVVHRGQRVGAAGRVLHLGVRRGELYVDPAALFGDEGPARLVPVPSAGRFGALLGSR